MALAIRRRVPAVAPSVFEIVTPRSNGAAIAAAESLLAGLAPGDPVSLEIAATSQARWFLARTAGNGSEHQLKQRIHASYPQATLRDLDLFRQPGLDPAHLRANEQLAACRLMLQDAACLPLRTFQDPYPDKQDGSLADPIAGILAALGSVPDTWRAVSQLVLQPAPQGWAKPYQQLLEEQRLMGRHAPEAADTSLTSVFGMAGLVLLLGGLFLGYSWYEAGDWLHLAELAGSGVGVAGAAVALAQKLGAKQVLDTRLIEEKLKYAGYSVELRLAVFAPEDAAADELEAQLQRLCGAYRHFTLTAGNSLKPARLDLNSSDALTSPVPVSPAKALPIFNALELASLWHLPQTGADVPLLERTAARQYLPIPYSMTAGCYIGTSIHQGRSIPVFLSPEQLARNLLALAKTGRGKSTLMELIAWHELNLGAGERPALLIIDPHQDLARAAGSLIPGSRFSDATYLDASNVTRPFGLNLIDAGLGWDRFKATSNVLAIFQRQFSEFWGPRMEAAFRFALLALLEANEVLCRGDKNGRQRQFTVLDIPALLGDAEFRRYVLQSVKDPSTTWYWTRHFNPLDRHMQLEVISPVQTKVFRFAGTQAARLIVGQPQSTVDPATWVRPGAITILNTAARTVGDDAAGLIGAALLNLVSLTVAERAATERQQRSRITILVDELQTMPGANYEFILSELGKFGANLITSTQGLARLDVIDRRLQRALRGSLFSNIDGLFVFNVSADDADFLRHELGVTSRSRTSSTWPSTVATSASLRTASRCRRSR